MLFYIRQKIKISSKNFLRNVEIVQTVQAVQVLAEFGLLLFV